MWLSLALVLIVADTAPAPAPRDDAAVGRIEGTVSVAGDGGLVVIAVEDAREEPRSVPRTFEVMQNNIAFHPEAIVVEVGDFVSFPNRDKTFHNVFSDTPGARFDLGLYQSGTARAVRMAIPGEVDVYCNVHEEMRGHVLVVPSRHYAVVDKNGHFAIEGVPVGRRKLLLWSSKLEPRHVRVAVKANETVRLDEKLETPRGLFPHLRKDGAPYPQKGYPN